MKNCSLLFLFLCINCIQTYAQLENLTLRFSVGVAFSEPDTRGKDFIVVSRFGEQVKQYILQADASILDSYFFLIEGNYRFRKRLELFGQVGNTVFYDDFPMVVKNEHFVKPGNLVSQEIGLVREYFNYSLSPAVGFNLRIGEYKQSIFFAGTSLIYNITYYKIITPRIDGRGNRPPRVRKRFFADTNSIEAFMSIGLGSKRSRFFIDFRYFLAEYLDDATYNDGIAIKYENLTKFRFRISHDLEWEKK